MGAERSQIFNQFICETLSLTLLGVLVALLVSHLSLPWFSNLLQIDLTEVSYATPIFFAGLAVLTILTTALAGFYPSLVCHGSAGVCSGRQQPENGEKPSAHGADNDAVYFFHFLITVCFTLYYQVTHLKNLDMGYDQEDVTYVYTSYNRPGTKKRLAGLRQGAGKSPGYPIHIGSIGKLSKPKHQVSPAWNRQRPSRILDLGIDRQFFDHYQIELAAGRNFNYDATSEHSKVDQRGKIKTGGAVILTTMGMDALGIKSAKDALGKTLEIVDGDNITFDVVGVVDAFPKILEGQDFHRLPALPVPW